MVPYGALPWEWGSRTSPGESSTHPGHGRSVAGNIIWLWPMGIYGGIMGSIYGAHWGSMGSIYTMYLDIPWYHDIQRWKHTDSFILCESVNPTTYWECKAGSELGVWDFWDWIRFIGSSWRLRPLLGQLSQNHHRFNLKLWESQTFDNRFFIIQLDQSWSWINFKGWIMFSPVFASFFLPFFVRWFPLVPGDCRSVLVLNDGRIGRIKGCSRGHAAHQHGTELPAPFRPFPPRVYWESIP